MLVREFNYELFIFDIWNAIVGIPFITFILHFCLTGNKTFKKELAFHFLTSMIFSIVMTLVL